MAELAAALVPMDRVPEMWPRVAAKLGEAIGRTDDFTEDDALAALDEGRWRLWIVARPGELVGVALTEVQQREARKVLFVQAAAGQAGEAVPALWPMLRQYARNVRCDAVQWAGRRGWLRSGFLPAGARFVAEVAELEV